MSTVIAVIATIAALVGILMAWWAYRQSKELSGRLARTNQRVEALREEMEREQRKLTREKQQLKADVVQLKGGNDGLADPGATGELVRPQAGPPPIREITPQTLKARIDQGDDLFVVDMRQPYEYQAGHIPGSVNIFIEHIPAHIDQIPRDKEVIFQCWHGNTSLQASAFLIDKGWAADRVASLSGGIAGWTQTNGMDSLVKD